MSQEWAERQRRTNRLVRIIAPVVLENRKATAKELYGLSKLTWITDSYNGEAASYIRSTKVPALENIFSRRYERLSLEEIADDASEITRSPQIRSLILGSTGFTNFYKAYRNSCLEWFQDHRTKIQELFRRGFSLQSDSEGLAIAREIESLPRVPKAKSDGSLMRPENLLTPILFALDQRIRFPLINGNTGVQNLLAKLRVSRASLGEQYVQLVNLYGKSGIRDAADLDQVGHDLPDLIEIGSQKRSKQLLQEHPVTGSLLPLKDESDIEALQIARSISHRRIHNVLTNRLRELLVKHTLLEGCRDDALFDVLVKNYNKSGDDLLIEAKSSAETAHVRMAIGQLYDYWFQIKGASTPHLAILTPAIPDQRILELLKWQQIGVLWIEDGALRTSSDHLLHLCDT